VHLGHVYCVVISSKLDGCEDIENSRCNFIGQANSLLCYFGKLDSVTKRKLFRTYSSSMYGCELWSLDVSRVNDFCIAWRKDLKRMWSVPYNTHGDFCMVCLVTYQFLMKYVSDLCVPACITVVI